MIRVIVVDDDPAFAAGLAIALQHDGHHVRWFVRPRDLPPFASLDADVLVTDYAMGADELSGVALADAARASRPDVPVILVTAHDGMELAAQAARRASFLTICRKPIGYDALHDTLHAVLRVPR
jgi:DNA-binding NtrC family response regulator